MAADEMGGTAADAACVSGVLESADQPGILRQAEVIVRAESKQALPVAFHVGAFSVCNGAQAALQLGLYTLGRLDGQTFEQIRPRHCSHNPVRSLPIPFPGC